jgi:hypothetical protein
MGIRHAGKEIGRAADSLVRWQLWPVPEIAPWTVQLDRHVRSRHTGFNTTSSLGRLTLNILLSFAHGTSSSRLLSKVTPHKITLPKKACAPPCAPPHTPGDSGISGQSFTQGVLSAAFANTRSVCEYRRIPRTISSAMGPQAPTIRVVSRLATFRRLHHIHYDYKSDGNINEPSLSPHRNRALAGGATGSL